MEEFKCHTDPNQLNEMSCRPKTKVEYLPRGQWVVYYCYICICFCYLYSSLISLRAGINSVTNNCSVPFYEQTDSTYTHNIENFVHKVCMLAREAGDEQQTNILKASSLQCLSAMVVCLPIVFSACLAIILLF